jgi:hypothetical protein
MTRCAISNRRIAANSTPFALECCRIFSGIKKPGKMPGLPRSSKSNKKTNSLLLLVGRLFALSLLLRGGAGNAWHGALRGFIGTDHGIGHRKFLLKIPEKYFSGTLNGWRLFHG